MPIAAVLRDELPATGLVLEVASGTGEHALWFAGQFPALDWQPSDPDADAIRSIAAWRDEGRLPNLRPPVMLDAGSAVWPVDRADAILCINMVHISPWASTLGLLDGAAHLLADGAALILYGPYLQDGVATAPGNLAFDADLRARHPAWGLRHVETVTDAAGQRGLTLARTVAMPANNLMLVLRRNCGDRGVSP